MDVLPASSCQSPLVSSRRALVPWSLPELASAVANCQRFRRRTLCRGFQRLPPQRVKLPLTCLGAGAGLLLPLRKIRGVRVCPHPAGPGPHPINGTRPILRRVSLEMPMKRGMYSSLVALEWGWTSGIGSSTGSIGQLLGTRCCSVPPVRGWRGQATAWPLVKRLVSERDLNECVRDRQWRR